MADEHWYHLHTIPESAFEEHETTAYIKGICGRYPVESIDLGMETGAVYYLDAGRDETVALRADIDALPTGQGPQHLCGHDAHYAWSDPLSLRCQGKAAVQCSVRVPACRGRNPRSKDHAEAWPAGKSPAKACAHLRHTQQT